MTITDLIKICHPSDLYFIAKVLRENKLGPDFMNEKLSTLATAMEKMQEEQAKEEAEIAEIFDKRLTWEHFQNYVSELKQCEDRWQQLKDRIEEKAKFLEKESDGLAKRRDWVASDKAEAKLYECKDILTWMTEIKRS